MQYFSSFFKKKIHLPYSDFDNEPFFEDKFKIILGNRISYKDEGSGPVIFCIPAWPMSSLCFTPFISGVKEYFRIIAIDLPGWGGKSPKMNMPATLENYALIIEEFIESFNVDKFYMMGYSLGGMLAQMVAERNIVPPEKIVFVSSTHSSKLLGEKINFVSNVYKFVKGLNLNDFLVKKIIVFFTLNLIRDKWYFSRYIKSKLYNLFESEEQKVDVQSIFDVLLSVTRTEVFKDKNAKKPKALILYGDEEEDFIIKSSIEIAKYYSVYPIILNNCDHYHFFVDVNKSDQIIVDFLN